MLMNHWPFQDSKICYVAIVSENLYLEVNPKSNIHSQRKVEILGTEDNQHDLNLTCFVPTENLYRLFS